MIRSTLVGSLLTSTRMCLSRAPPLAFWFTTNLPCRGGEEVLMDVAGQDATLAFEVPPFNYPSYIYSIVTRGL